MCRSQFITCLLLFLLLSVTAQTNQHTTTLAVLDFGSTSVGKLAAARIRGNLREAADLRILDPDLIMAAAHGVGYAGSLNLSLQEARDLGSAMSADFFILGDAQTLRRSSSERTTYFESYCSIFLVSSRTGRLISWRRISKEADDAITAEADLVKELAAKDLSSGSIDALRKAQLEESKERALRLESQAPLIEEAPEDDKSADAQGLRLPRPFRRLRPTYPGSAAQADVEATVDVLVDIDVDGEVRQIEVSRWAGFGLDESTIATVRKLHFFPAMRNGTPIPMRVLLRYNFRKSSQ